jgi:hypothetical protein
MNFTSGRGRRDPPIAGHEDSLSDRRTLLGGLRRSFVTGLSSLIQNDANDVITHLHWTARKGTQRRSIAGIFFPSNGLSVDKPTTGR